MESYLSYLYCTLSHFMHIAPMGVTDLSRLLQRGKLLCVQGFTYIFWFFAETFYRFEHY